MIHQEKDCKGASIKYVRTEGGAGPKIGRFCGQTVLRKCGQGGEGVQNPENFADVLNGSPLTEVEKKLPNDSSDTS